MEKFLTGYTGPPAKRAKSCAERLDQQRLYDQSKRKRTYLSKWEVEFKWLQHVETGMICTICKKFEKFGTFVHGNKNYKKETLVSHEKSETHVQHVLTLNAKKDPFNKDAPAVKALLTLNEKTINQLAYKFRNVHYLSRKGRPFTDYPLLCELDAAKGLDIGAQYINDKSCADFSYYIAEAERNKIRKQISEAKYISVISDGSVDCSVQESEIVYIRYCYKGLISVNFSTVKNIPRGDSESIANAMIDGMKLLCGDNYGQKIVATGTDGASSMLGHKKGAVQQIRDITNRPWIVGVHCSGHKIELAFKDAIKTKIALFDKVDSLLLNIYYFYRNSNVNRSGLKESYRSLNQKVLLPVRVGGTRWVSHLKKAVETFVRGYPAITQHLGQLQNRDSSVSRTEKGNRAKNFYKTAMLKDVWLMLSFLMDVLTVLGDVSKAFQEKTALISSVLFEIKSAVRNLERLRYNDGVNLRKAKENLPDGLKGYGDQQIANLVDYFDVPLNQAGVDVQAIENEWSKMKDQIYCRFEQPSMETWQSVNDRLGNMFPNILSLVDLINTIPASSADAERGFNRLKTTKSDWRSKLVDHRLTDQLCIMLESEQIKNFDPLPAINLWNKQPRRIKHDVVKPSQTTRNNLQVSNEQQVPVTITDPVVQETENQTPAVDENSDTEELEPNIMNDTSEFENNEPAFADDDEEYMSNDDYIDEDNDLERDDLLAEKFNYNDRLDLAKKAYFDFCDMMERT